MTTPARTDGIRFDFRDRVVLVTGVARPGQIGYAVARAFGEAGAKLVVCDRNAVAVSERARELAALGLEARPAAGDLTEPDAAAIAMETAQKHFGRLDVVVNVAGGLTTYGPIERTTVADFDREVAINLKTTFLVSQAAVEPLAATRGAIVNFASIAYVQPAGQMAVYTAAKAAVAGFTRSLAVELFDRGIRVNAIAPGMVRTGDNVSQAGPEAHYVEMAQIADGVLFLASDAASGITGHVMPITRGKV
ncbi:MAG TPA: SDR family NAD(P)-dependent oxidoreductase [Gemmatimonadales bacterium]|nr:SDR family NAD(P)-dependent oxidoreductase [Gemmatimonadales bacterium]